NHEGTARRAFSAWLKAPRSRSSSQLSRTWLASPYVDLFLALSEGGESARPAQPIQAAGPLRPDAADRDIELGVDLRVGVRRVAASQPGNAAGSRSLPSCSTSKSQTFCPTSSMS